MAAPSTFQFLGEPKHSIVLRQTQDDFDRLANNSFLTTTFLDSIFQKVTTKFHSDYVCGSTRTGELLNIFNSPYREERNKSSELRIKERMMCFDKSREQKFVFPNIHASHFFVMEVVVTPGNPDIILSIRYFDFAKRTRRSDKPGVTKHSSAGKLVTEFVKFWNHYALETRSPKIELDVMLGKTQACASPYQHNGYDCGLFTIGVALYLLYNIPLDNSSFTQQNVTNFCKKYMEKMEEQDILQAFNIHMTALLR